MASVTVRSSTPSPVRGQGQAVEWRGIARLHGLTPAPQWCGIARLRGLAPAHHSNHSDGGTGLDQSGKRIHHSRDDNNSHGQGRGGAVVLPRKILKQQRVRPGDKFEIIAAPDEPGIIELRRLRQTPNAGLVQLLRSCPVKGFRIPKRSKKPARDFNL